MNRRRHPIAIHWFRQDLRLNDNPALTAAAESHDILPVYIQDMINAGHHFPGAASRWWLHRSLTDLNRNLDGHLRCYSGDPAEILRLLIDQYAVQAVSWNRCYEPWQIRRDRELKASLHDQDIEVLSHNGSLLWEPWDVLKGDKTPYRVFTPYYKNGCLQNKPPRAPLPR
ncbi:MAG: deoxyribodipyrimidine photo-lyase, partial [Methyloligellaceae bacterium]